MNPAVWRKRIHPFILLPWWMIDRNIIHMQPPKPKEVHALAGEIIRLEIALAAAKEKYNALFGITAKEKRTRSMSLDGINAKALEFIEARPGQDLAISTVAVGIGEEEVAVGRSLYKLYSAGKIAKPKRGIYRAIEKEVSPEEKTS